MFSGEDRKTPSESNSPSSSSLSALSDSANSKDDSDSSQKNKSGNNVLVISVVPGSQPSLNSEEKPEKGKGGGCGPAQSSPVWEDDPDLQISP